MISRFPSSPLFRRLICCLLALATVCLCLAPALVQPALALAGIDDATLAVGLLFCSWAGVTFATNQGAATAVTSFLNSSVNGLKACSEVASKYVVDGSLALVQGVQDAFNSVLPDINSTFRTPDGSTEGALVGSTPVGVDLPITSDPLSVPGDSCVLSYTDSRGSLHHLTPFLSDRATFYLGCSDCDQSYYASTISDTADSVSPLSVSISDGMIRLFFPRKYVSGKYAGREIGGVLYLSLFGTPTLKLLTKEEQVAFKRSKEIDGTQIQEITFAPGGVWEPSPDDPTQPDMSQWPGLSLAALLALLANQNSGSPNLDPEKMIEELRQALNGGSGGGDGPTVTDPTTPPTDPGSSGDAADAPPDFKNMMLPGLKDFFPFCIPFDIYNMMSALCTEPVAPKFTFATSFLGHLYSVDIDLSAWDNVAIMIRYMVVAIYIVSLAVATRKFIKW